MNSFNEPPGSERWETLVEKHGIHSIHGAFPSASHHCEAEIGWKLEGEWQRAGVFGVFAAKSPDFKGLVKS